jgi:ankyrin repeat protein
MQKCTWPLLALVCCAALAQARPQIIAAAARGDTAGVQRALAADTALDTPDVDGTTALHWAVRGDHEAVVTLLLAAGASATVAEHHGVTPLQLAAQNGNPDILRRLLDAGADPNETGPSGETVLISAARTGLPEALALLLDRGAHVDGRDTNFAQTALMAAAREGHADAVDLLLERGADVNAQTRMGPTPPFVPPCKGTGCGSEGEGHTKVAGLLIDAGADIELADANGIRPLLIAALNNRIAAGEALLRAGADPNADDFWGRTPLLAAVEYRNLDMNNREQDSPTHNGVDRAPVLGFVRTLLDAGADPNARTREVPPPRRWLYSLNDVSWVDFTGQTPFLRAALSGDTSSMRLLLEYGADPNIATLAGTTPLMAAAGVNWVVAQTYTESMEQSLAAVALCLELGNDINATNSMGLSALLGAVNRGANDIVRFLAERGADLDVVDVQGRTAMRWAEGVFLAAVGAERKPATIALLEDLKREAVR